MSSLTLSRTTSDDLSPLLTQLSMHDLQLSTSSFDSSPPPAGKKSTSPTNKTDSLRGRATLPLTSPQQVKNWISEQTDSRSDQQGDVLQEINFISRDVSGLLDQIYEIQELRHSTSSSSSTAPSSPPGNVRMDSMLYILEASTRSLASQMAALPNMSADPTAREGLSELKANWSKFTDQHAMLKEELKEDGWLIRFRTTADQAEAMMDPLTRSSFDLSRYVERVSTSPSLVPYEAELEDQPSIRQLLSLAKGHESMKGTYVPSINKILKMMGRSISERSTKNGEALRRYGDMQSRWATLQRQLQQLDARIRLISSQHHASPMSPSGHVEILSTYPSVYEGHPSDYFGVSLPGKVGDAQNTRSHASSISSGVSSASTPFRGSAAPRQSIATLSPDISTQPLRRRPSVISSQTTARSEIERPPWNSYPRPEIDPQKTPSSKRLSSFGTPYSRSGSASPTPSVPSVTSSVLSRPNAAGSRIPVISPKSKGPTVGKHNLMDVPALAVSTSHGQTFLSEASSRADQGRNHLDRARESMKTPERHRNRPNAAYSAFQPRPSIPPGLGNRSFSSGNTPRTAPQPRQSLRRAPPSSFRAVSPTPGGSGTRTSSRMSAVSYSNFNAADLQPFEPSKYDFLDRYVQSILSETGFDLFVGRVDPPLRKTQRKRDDEDWKGDFVFGGGERPVSVKLLKLAGRSIPGETGGARMKCLVRTGGAWQDLAGLLKKRKAEAGVAGVDLP